MKLRSVLKLNHHAFFLTTVFGENSNDVFRSLGLRPG